MPKPSLAPIEIQKIIQLRQTGHSLPEIKKATGRGYGTVFRYIKNVPILPQYQEVWRIKRGGSKFKAFKEMEAAKQRSRTLLSSINERDKLLILAALYWGEGTKSELIMTNSDPEMLRVFLSCLRMLGISNEQLTIKPRIFEDMAIAKTLNFWSQTLGVPRRYFGSVTVLKGKKQGKLKYGMCRIRVSKGKDHFKFIMAMIDFIKSEINAAVVQRIERGFPKP